MYEDMKLTIYAMNWFGACVVNVWWTLGRRSPDDPLFLVRKCSGRPLPFALCSSSPTFTLRSATLVQLRDHSCSAPAELLLSSYLRYCVSSSSSAAHSTSITLIIAPLFSRLQRLYIGGYNGAGHYWIPSRWLPTSTEGSSKTSL